MGMEKKIFSRIFVIYILFMIAFFYFSFGFFNFNKINLLLISLTAVSNLALFIYSFFVKNKRVRKYLIIASSLFICQGLNSFFVDIPVGNFLDVSGSFFFLGIIFFMLAFRRMK